MAIEFEFYQSPHTFGEKTKKYYPKVVNYRTVTTQELAEEIHSGSTLTTADIRATIDALSYQIAQHLSESERVHVEGIGFFEVSLQCPETENPKETRAGKVKFKSVNFRADKALKERMHKAQTIRSKRKVHSSAFSPEKMDEKLTVYFQTNLFLMRRDLEQLDSNYGEPPTETADRGKETEKYRDALSSCLCPDAGLVRERSGTGG